MKSSEFGAFSVILGDTTPNFLTNSKSSVLGHSNDLSIVSEFLWESGENQQNVFPF